jgi:hypothetical protein
MRIESLFFMCERFIGFFVIGLFAIVPLAISRCDMAPLAG